MQAPYPVGCHGGRVAEAFRYVGDREPPPYVAGVAEYRQRLVVALVGEALVPGYPVHRFGEDIRAVEYAGGGFDSAEPGVAEDFLPPAYLAFGGGVGPVRITTPLPAVEGLPA